jgi:hypothetical protein
VRAQLEPGDASGQSVLISRQPRKTGLAPDQSEGSAEASAWAPLRIAVFRALWLASLVGVTGSWLQTVGAQWLLVHRPHASILVSLV